MKGILASMLLLWASNAALAAERTVTLAIEKMHCVLCPITVAKAIERVEGVANVSVDFQAKTAAVTFDDVLTDWRALAAASTNAGYPATLIDE